MDLPSPLRRFHPSLLALLGTMALLGWPAAAVRAAEPTPAFLTNGLVAYYPFDGNANDVSGKKSHGRRPVAGKWAVDRFGKASGALDCSPGNRGVIAPPAAVPVGDEFTFSVWLRVDTARLPVDFDQPFLALNGQQYAIRIRSGAGSTDGPALITVVQPFDSQRFMDFRGDWFASWFHFVLTTSRGKIRGFVNGKPIQWVFDSAPKKDQLMTRWAAEPLQLGSSGGFAGSLDDVRIYKRALSEAEVLALHQHEVKR